MTFQIIEVIRQKAPVILGHRGSKSDAPMNTLPAFALALEQGADGFELDVQLSADGVPVVIHDDTVDATTNGTGVVTDMTLESLQMLDAGSWFAPQFAETRIPTLAQVFEQFGQRAWINVELKTMASDPKPLASAVANCIVEYNMQERVLISSFHPLALQSFRRILPEIAIGYLLDPDYDTRSLMQDISYEAFHPRYTMVDEAMMQNEKQANRLVNVWTINDPQEAQRLFELGVHTFITDYPAKLVQQFGA
jgi:glycerophosphoryl diester phosphodiesterase